MARGAWQARVDRLEPVVEEQACRDAPDLVPNADQPAEALVADDRVVLRDAPPLVVSLRLGEEAGCYDNAFQRQCGARRT